MSDLSKPDRGRHRSCRTQRNRSVVWRDLGEERPLVDVTGIFGLGDSGGSDIATRKDEYMGDAVEAQHLPKTGGGAAIALLQFGEQLSD